MNQLPCEDCGGLPCREGCVMPALNRLFSLPVCAHGVVLVDRCEDCEAAVERAAREYAAECAANRAAVGIV